jgi:hypothetical protein
MVSGWKLDWAGFERVEEMDTVGFGKSLLLLVPCLPVTAFHWNNTTDSSLPPARSFPGKEEQLIG